MKKSVYLDTTIPSYYFDDRPALKFQCEITKKWWVEESRSYNIFISPETVAELGRGNYPRKEKLLEFISKMVQLEQTQEINIIVDHYIKNNLMPKDVRGDAVHLAYASFYNTVVWQIQFKANKNSELRREAPFVIFVSHNKPNEASQCLRSPTLLNRY